MKGCRFLVWSSLALIAQGICFIDAKHLEAT
ncbi:unknown [Eggerthella sp. CAG:209]|nr:unknown [Eggerthella sp. CAG:209]